MSDARAREQRVMRCDCGLFVRLDRGLVESEPPAADLADADFDEATHMFASLDEIERFSRQTAKSDPPAQDKSPSPARSEQPKDIDDDDEATRVVSSPLASPLRLSAFLPQQQAADAKPGNTAPSKLIWYVDLGGSTIEMTIDKLIMARRSGKIGESALVWRPGMARWRPVGSLIAAAGSGAQRPLAERSRPSNPRISLPPPALPSSPLASSPSAAAPSKPAPSKPPPAPSRRENSGPMLAVYERPAATLEFALEEQAPPRRAEPSKPPPSRESGRPISTRPAARTEVTELRKASLFPPRSRAAAFLTSLPGWATIAIPAVACTALAIAGALLVRSLRAPRPLPALSTATTAAIATPKATPPPPPAPVAPAPEPSPEPIVDVDSLSLEKPVQRPKLATVASNAQNEIPAARFMLEESATETSRQTPGEAEPAEESAKPSAKADAGAATGATKDAGSAKNPLLDLGDQEEKNPFYNPGF